MKIRALVLPAVLLAVLLAAACRPDAGTPRAVAEGFLDNYYVAVDLHAARGEVEGLAADKVAQVIELAAEAGEELRGFRPRVNYTLGFAEEGEELARYEYELRVESDGGDAIAQLVLLTLRRGPRGWKVSNYSESERD